MTRRMGIALVSLVAAIVALYLHLWKLGIAGTLACTSNHACEYVQGSQYGWFLGVDVALIGTVGYTTLFIAALVSIAHRFENERWPNTVMQVLIWPAIAFTIRLKYYEWFVLKSFCWWCFISVVCISTCAVLVTLDRRRLAALDATA